MPGFKGLEYIVPRKCIQFEIFYNVDKSLFAMMLKVLVLNLYIILNLCTNRIKLPQSAASSKTRFFDGNTYKSIGPFDTEEELFNALKEYTDTEVEAGTMSQAEATALLEKYQ